MMNIIGFSGLDTSVAFKKKAFPNLPPPLYRIAQGLDSAAALVTTDGVRAASAEERFTGEKGTESFPFNAIHYCLEAANMSPNEIDYIAHNFSYEPHKSYFELSDFTMQQYHEVYAPSVQLRCIEHYFPDTDWTSKYVEVPHHLAHAASAYYLSGFEESLILISDAMGELHSMTIAIGKGNSIEIIKQIPGLHSLGILYSLFTLYLGFAPSSDEYKVMGLAPYGNSRRYFSKFMEFFNLKNDGTYTIPLLFHGNSVEERETYQEVLEVLSHTFGPPRERNAEITQKHMDIAAALQAALQVCLLHVLHYFKQETGQQNLCMAGGTALNCTANGVIERSRLFKHTFVQPAAGDDGTALGAALYVQHMHDPSLPNKRMALPLWGSEYDDQAIQKVLDSRAMCQATHFASFEKLAEDVVRCIAQGQVVAWFQGRMEYGPRALGNRSILADPRNSDMRDHLNAIVKQRESFRPFAPATTIEKAAQYFDIEDGKEPLHKYMLFVTQVRKAYQKLLPAITHVDGSARLQVVSKEDNFRFWSLITAFEQVSGVPVVLNTSFNLKGQPIIRTPEEAIDTFLASEIDMLVIGNFIVTHRNS